MNDFVGLSILVGDTVAFTGSNGTDLDKGHVTSFGEKMVMIDRIGRGWPQKVKRYPNQIIVLEPVCSDKIPL